MDPLAIGDVTVSAIEEVSGPRLDPLRILPDATIEQIDGHAHWMAPDLYAPDRKLLAMVRQTYVVRTTHHTILIDTCVGDDKERTNPVMNRLKSPWLANFRAQGLAFEDIDFVMCTHFHVDHVGWNTRLENGRWVPTFPNARYLFGKTEFAFWQAELKRGPDPDGPIFEDSVLPVVEAGLAEIVADDYELSDGIWLEHTPGHTPGHVCVRLRNRSGEAVFSGDLMHHPIQVREPQWNSCFCRDGPRARATRRGFLERYSDSGILVIPAHFERGTVGRLESTSEGWHYDFLAGGSTRAAP